MREWVATRWSFAKRCWEHAQHHVVTTVIGAVALVVGAYSEWGEVVSLPPVKHRLPLSWALVIALVCLSFILIEGGYRLLHTTGSGVLPTDPLVYFDILDHRESLERSTPLLIVNRGGSIAHKIRITPITLSVGSVTFKEVDTLPSSGDASKVEVDPLVGFVSVWINHDLFNALQHEANAMDKGSEKEFPKTVYATYENVSGKSFRVSFDLVYSPLNNILHDNHKTSPLAKRYKICEVRNTKIIAV